MSPARRSRFRSWTALVVLLLGVALVAWASCSGDGPPPLDPSRDEDGSAEDAGHPPDSRDPRDPANRRPRTRAAPSAAGDGSGAPIGAEETPGASAPTPAAEAPPAPASREPALPKVTVRVLRPDGTPAVGATVLLLRSSATTDASGCADVEWTGESFARAPIAWLGSESALGPRLLHSPPPAPIELRLSPGLVVRGRAVDQSGAPLPGAQIRAEFSYPHSGRWGTFETTSRTEGRFELPPLPLDPSVPPPSEVRLTARYLELAPVELRVPFASASERDAVLEFFRGGVVRGRLLLPDGTPAKGRIVAVAGLGHRVTLGDSGRFEIALPRGDATLLAMPWPWVQLSGPPIDTDPARGWAAFRRLGEFRGDQGDRDLGDVVLGFGRDVTCVVADAEGEAVRGAEIAVRLGGDLIQHGTTDASGAFTIRGLGDDGHEVRVADPWIGSHWAQRATSRTGVRGDARALRFVLGGNGIVVRLLDPAGAPLHAERSLAWSAHDARTGAPETWGNAWANGVSVLRVAVPAGAYTLRIECDGHEPATTTVLSVRDDADTAVDVRLSRKP